MTRSRAHHVLRWRDEWATRRVPSPPVLRFFSLFLLTALLVGLAPTDAHAHSGKQSYLYLSIYDETVEGRVEMPVGDLGRVLGLDIPTNTSGARAAIGEFTDPIIGYVMQNMSLSGESGPWDIALADSLTILSTENGPYVVLPFVVDETFTEAATSFTVEFSVIIEADPDKDALLIIEDDWATATFDNGSEPLLGFSVGMTERQVELTGASTIDSMAVIRGIGTDAVRTGIDLMLIIVAVVVPAVLVPASSSRAHVVSSVQLARRLGAALAALIAGHTISLWLVGTGVLAPPERLTAVLVAVGLCAMAIFGLLSWWRPRLWSTALWVIVAVGVLQGLGLGAFFDAQGLDRRRPLTSLLAFHIGVEVALVVLVVLVAVPLVLLRRTRVSSIAAVGLGVILVGYGVAWLGERITDADWPIEEVANPLRVWPRNVVFVALAIAICAVIRRADARSERLRPIEGAPAVTEPAGERHDQEAVLR